MMLKDWIAQSGGPKSIAKKLHITEHAVRKWMRRQSTPRPKTAQLIVRWSRGEVTHETIINETCPRKFKQSK